MLHEGQRVVQLLVAVVHDRQAQLRVLHQYLLQAQRAAVTDAHRSEAEEGRTGRPAAQVDRRGDIQFFHEGPVGLHTRVVRGDPDVLVCNFPEDPEFTTLEEGPHVIGRQRGLATDL